MKVLVVGLGGVGQRHVRNLRQITGSALELTAYRVRGLSRVLTPALEVEAGREVATTYGLRETDDLDAALAARPDAVLICNPTSQHLPAALAAARAGSALFVEKPLADSWEGVEELVALVRRRGLVSLVGYQMRFHPVLRRLREIVEADAIGRIVTVLAEVGEFLPDWHRYEDYRDLYASRRALGGGVVLTQIHELDYLGWLFGPPERVFALGGRFGELDIDVEDTASILLECRHRGRLVPVHLHQDFVTRPPTRRCEVIGEDGRIEADFQARTVRVTAADGRVTESSSYPEFERNQMFLDEMSHFLACLRGEAEPVVSIADAAVSLRVALAARQSLERGTPVAIG